MKKFSQLLKRGSKIVCFEAKFFFNFFIFIIFFGSSVLKEILTVNGGIELFQ